MKSASPYWILALLIVGCFSAATLLQPQAVKWSQSDKDSVMKVLLGDSRRLFANHFFTKADIYFHSGYYPSIFDQRPSVKESHMTGHEDEHGDEDHEKEGDFLGKPKDWVEKFGRNFMITEHTHLGHGKEKEILPWLKISAELDPHLVDTYTVAAFWLANHLGKVVEAEQFLREGLRNNPNSFEILFSLGRLYFENDHDSQRARNVWELALRRWNENERNKDKPNKLAFEEITLNLARLEEKEGNYAQAITYLEAAKQESPSPQTLEKQIEDLKGKQGRSQK